MSKIPTDTFSVSAKKRHNKWLHQTVARVDKAFGHRIWNEKAR